MNMVVVPDLSNDASLKRPNLALYKFKKFSGDDWQGKIAKVIAHNARAIKLNNAYKDIQPIILHGPALNMVMAACEAKVAEHKHPKGYPPRSNAVRAVEHLLSASQDHFEVDGKRVQAKIDLWAQTNLEWLKKEFGTNLVSVVMHLDEDVPHIHAITVPLVGGRLNAAAETGHPYQLRQIQDRYGEAMAPLGIQRGLADSKATPEERQKFYARVKRAIGPLKMPPVMARPKATFEERHNGYKGYVERILKEQHKALTDTFSAILKPYKAKAENHDIMIKDYNAMYAQNLRLKSIPREIGLLDVMKKSAQDVIFVDKEKRHVFNTPRGEIRVTKNKFENTTTGLQSAGTVELVMHLHQMDVNQAVGWIKDNWSEKDAEACYARHHSRMAKRVVLQLPAQKTYRLPTPPTRDWLEEFLLNKLHVSKELALELQWEKGVSVSDAGHIVFRRDGLQMQAHGGPKDVVTGAEISSINGKLQCLDVGSDMTCGHFRSPPEAGCGRGTVAVCSTGLSAIAYRELKGDDVISAYGCRNSKALIALVETLAEHIRTSGSVVIAMDSIKAERRLGTDLKRMLEIKLGNDPVLCARISVSNAKAKVFSDDKVEERSWVDVLKERNDDLREAAIHKDHDESKAELLESMKAKEVTGSKPIPATVTKPRAMDDGSSLTKQ
jgi:hypothetical protein